jgi:hypothetical protein
VEHRREENEVLAGDERNLDVASRQLPLEVPRGVGTRKASAENQDSLPVG